MNNYKTNIIEGEHSPREVVKFALLIIAIIALSLVLSFQFGPVTLTSWMRWFMGVFFLVFALFKFLGYRMFVAMFAGYDIVAKRFKVYSYAYPFIEFALALLFLFDYGRPIRDILALIIMGVGSIGVAQEIRRKSGVHCACLGNFIKLPLSTTSLVEDLTMGLMALVMLVI